MFSTSWYIVCQVLFVCAIESTARMGVVGWPGVEALPRRVAFTERVTPSTQGIYHDHVGLNKTRFLCFCMWPPVSPSESMYAIVATDTQTLEQQPTVKNVILLMSYGRGAKLSPLKCQCFNVSVVVIGRPVELASELM